MPLRLPRRRGQLALVRAHEDPDAFADFYDLYAERVVVFFLRRVLDPELAFDLMSEVFASAWQHRRQFRGSSVEEEQGWLFAIARNELAKYWRRGRLERNALLRLEVPRSTLEDAEIERLSDLAEASYRTPALRRALSVLPPEQRRAVELRVVLERTYAEISEELAVTQVVARARVSRGLRALAFRLHEEEQMLAREASA